MFQAIFFAGGFAVAAVPWGQKPILPSLLTPAHKVSLESSGVLSKAQLTQLEALRQEIQLEVGALREEDGLSVEQFNDVAARISELEVNRLKKVAGASFTALLDWADRAWEADSVAIQTRQHAPRPPSGDVTYTVFATQYAPNDAAAPDELAVPDVCIKFANLGWTSELASWGCPATYQAGNAYSVHVVHGSDARDVWVGEVGPWNHHDNYWNAAGDPDRPRRMWTDLDRGMPEAQAAFRDNYNGGLDEFGRTVLNQAGIDLTPTIAATLGLAYLENDWVEVTWLWETDTGADTDTDTGAETDTGAGVDTPGDTGAEPGEDKGFGFCATGPGRTGGWGASFLLSALVCRRRST